MRQVKTEFYPDGFDKKGDPLGPRTMVLDFRVSNNKRWKKMTTEEKSEAFALIAQFKERLTNIQKDLFPES